MISPLIQYTSFVSKSHSENSRERQRIAKRLTQIVCNYSNYHWQLSSRRDTDSKHNTLNTHYWRCIVILLYFTKCEITFTPPCMYIYLSTTKCRSLSKFIDTYQICSFPRNPLQWRIQFLHKYIRRRDNIYYILEPKIVNQFFNFYLIIFFDFHSRLWPRI